MYMWFFMLGVLLLLPIFMIIFAYIFSYRPPKNINSLYGYRTKRSMKNDETWKFAHQYYGHLWTRLGWIVLALSVVAFLTCYGRSDEVIGLIGVLILFAQIVPIFLTLAKTEKALKEKFGD